jgi:hypothetical protein
VNGTNTLSGSDNNKYTTHATYSRDPESLFEKKKIIKIK